MKLKRRVSLTVLIFMSASIAQASPWLGNGKIEEVYQGNLSEHNLGNIGPNLLYFNSIQPMREDVIPNANAQDFFLKDSQVEIFFKNLSSDGTKVTAVYRVENPNFKGGRYCYRAIYHKGDDRRVGTETRMLPSLLSSEKPFWEFTLQLALESCDGHRVVSGNPKGLDLEETIRSFYELDTENFDYCQLKVLSSFPMDVPRSEHVYDVKQTLANISALNSGDLYLESKNRMDGDGESQRIYFKSKKSESVDLEKAERAWSEGQRFMDALKKYGELLILSKDLSPKEREEVASRFLEENRREIVESLKGLNEGYTGLPLRRKIKASRAIQSLYRHIHILEGSIIKKFELDTVVTSKLEPIDLR